MRPRPRAHEVASPDARRAQSDPCTCPRARISLFCTRQCDPGAAVCKPPLAATRALWESAPSEPPKLTGTVSIARPELPLATRCPVGDGVFSLHPLSATALRVLNKHGRSRALP